MAGSRIEKLGTVFSRVQGLLRSGAMKQTDKPVWYDVYAAFPPRIEPKYERPVQTQEPREILYREDTIRAKFYKTFISPDVIDMKRHDDKTVCQRFVQKHSELLASHSGCDEEILFDKVVEALRVEQGISLKTFAQFYEERETKRTRNESSLNTSSGDKIEVEKL